MSFLVRCTGRQGRGEQRLALPLRKADSQGVAAAALENTLPLYLVTWHQGFKKFGKRLYRHGWQAAWSSGSGWRCGLFKVVEPWRCDPL